VALSRKTVAFVFNGLILSTLSGSCVASAAIAVPVDAGTHPVTVALSGDSTRAAASTLATLAVR
jgi:hypothetical protein